MAALNEEWSGYKSAVYAAAADFERKYALPDPRAAVPESLRPGKHRVHNAYIWLGGLVGGLYAAIAIIVSLVGNLAPVLADGGEPLPVFLLPAIIGGSILVGVLILGIIFLMQWLSWKYLSYELGKTELSMYSGIISKKRRHVPYQRVQSVNQQAGVLQRIFGLCNVKIDTAGGAANEAITLRYVRNSDAEALRSELFRRKKVLLAGGELDEFGNAFVAGSVVPSAWMLACAGGNQAALAVIMDDDPRVVAMRQELGVGDAGMLGQAAVAGAPGIAAAVGLWAADQGTSENTNVLDAADEVLSDLRGVFGGAEVETGAVSFEEGLSNKELLFAGMSGANASFAVVLAGIIGVVGTVANGLMGVFWDQFDSFMVQEVGQALDLGVAGYANRAIFGVGASVVLGVIGLTVVVWLLSVVGTVVQYGGYKVRRRESRVEVEHGLLQRNFSGVDVDRVQSVIIKQSFIRRCIGYCELSLGRIDSAGDSQDSSTTQAQSRSIVVHPFVKLDRVPELLEGLVPEYAHMPQMDVKPPAVALRRAIVRKSVIRSSMFWVTACAVACFALAHGGSAVGWWNIPAEAWVFIHPLFAGWMVLFALVFALNAANAVLWFKGSCMGYNRAFLCMKNAGFAVKTVLFPRKKIQFGYVQANPFQRHAKVATVYVRTAEGIAGTTEDLWDVAEEDAHACLTWLCPRNSAAKK